MMPVNYFTIKLRIRTFKISLRFIKILLCLTFPWKEKGFVLKNELKGKIIKFTLM
jgi:hypothetical protein